MSRRVDFETVLKDKFFYFKSEEGDVAVTTATEFGQNIPQSGACRLRKWFFKHTLVFQSEKEFAARDRNRSYGHDPFQQRLVDFRRIS